MSWRDRVRPIIARVLQEHSGQDEAEIRSALYAAYPFGERQYHPYQIWRDEILRQTGKRPPLGTSRKRPRPAPARIDLRQYPEQGKLDLL
jgi:hypothetical protein